METNLLTLLFPLVLGGIFAALGIALLIFGMRERQKAKAAESWPVVTGTIISSRLDQSTRTERREGRTYTRTSYAPVIEYSYEISGRTYQGNRIFPGATMSYDLGTAQGIVNRYQPGSQVSIHYDPTDSTKAALETKSKGGNLFMIIGGVFAVLGIVGCCVGVLLALAGSG